MDEDLIGYLLNALDPETQREVERYLETSPEGRQRLEKLREALAPLAADKAGEPPPADLVFKTLRRAGLTPSSLSFGRRRRFVGGGARGQGGWRRADVFIAASIGLVVLMLLPPSLMYLRQRDDLVRCSDNLKAFGDAFAHYANDHNGELPRPEASGPLAAAGIYAPALRDAGYLKGPRVYCPRIDTGLPQLVPDLALLRTMEESPQYHLVRRSMGGSYAFNLGYVDNQRKFQPIRKDLGDDVPVLCDRPPRPSERAFYRLANSPNHNFDGQNVLFLGGNVRFLKSRYLGDDDLFLNVHNHIAVGIGPKDAVLAPSEFPPFPKGWDEEF